MWPTILSVGPLAIHSFGVLVFLGVFLGGFSFWQKGREDNFEEEVLMDVFLSSLVAGFVFARAWYVFSNWEYFEGSFYKMMFLTKFPGLAYEGVVVGGLLGLVVFSIKKKLNAWKVLEVSVYSLLVIEMFGFVGSFLAGSSLGSKTSLFFGVPFPGVDDRRYPVQLMYVVLLWGLYSLIKKLSKEYRSFSWYSSLKGEAKPGFLLASYLIGVGLIHGVLGLVSEESNLWFSLSLSLTGFLILLLRSGINLNRKKKEVEKDLPKESKRKKLKKRKKKGFDFK